MRKFNPCACILFAGCVFILLSAACAEDARINLLPNPGFEDLDVKGNVELWRVNPGKNLMFETAEAVSAPQPVKSGEYALKLVQTGKTEKGKKFGHFFSTIHIPVKPLTEYTMSFWAKGTGMVRASVYAYTSVDGATRLTYPGYPALKTEKDEPGGDRTYYTVEEGTPWKKCSYTFSLTTDGTSVEKIAFVVIAHGTIHVDDCRFGEKQ